MLSVRPMSDLDQISSYDEITRILKAAEATSAEVYCSFAEDGLPTLTVELEIRGVSGTNVVLGIKKKEGAKAQMLTAGFPNGVKIGSPIEVVFSLVDGQYAIRDVVQDTSMTTLTVSAGRHLLRLQRRKDFRVSVRSDGLKFERLDKIVGKPTDKSGAVSFQILDLSAGGLRLLWLPAAGPLPAMGSVLKGRLHLGNETEKKVIDVEMRFVKDHGLDSPLKPEGGQALSFQFQGLGQAEGRTVLFTCLLIHRKNYGSG